MLLHELVLQSTSRDPAAIAITYQSETLPYEALARQVRAFACGCLNLGLDRGERVAVYLEKRLETVVAIFGAAAAGGVFVPVNPLLKPAQVAHILRDCNVRILVTSANRLKLLEPILRECSDLRCAVVVGSASKDESRLRVPIVSWDDALADGGNRQPHRVIDTDMAAILYTSGSTGKPKRVVLSHRNMVAGAASVAQYLENRADDRSL